MKNLISWCAAVFLLSTVSVSFAAEKENNVVNKADFFTTNGAHLSLKGKNYYVVGTNMWYGGYLGSSGKVGDRARLIKELDNLKSLGINNIRVLAVSEKAEHNSAVHPASINGFGDHNEELLAGLDFFMAEIAKRDISAVIYLNNFWQWSGGMTQYMSWIEGTPAQDPNVTKDWEGFMAKSASFYQSKKAQAEWRKTIKKIVTRVNTVTGKSYINDPAILSWQLANEPRAGNSSVSAKDKAIYIKWVNETAKYIHDLDPNHMVSTGAEGLMGAVNDEKLYSDAHASPYINYLTYHMWIRNWGWFDKGKPAETWDGGLTKANEYLNVHIDIANKLKKPLVLEEFGLDRDFGSYILK